MNLAFLRLPPVGAPKLLKLASVGNRFRLVTMAGIWDFQNRDSEDMASSLHSMRR
jgi:hypothetical protein